MGVRASGGWKLRLPAGHETYTVRFRHNGRRVEKSTGRTDPKEAADEAARIYADVVSGRRVARPVASDLATAVASFLADFELEASPAWANIVTLYFRAHLIPFFGSFDRFTAATYADYGRQRLQRASRPTVRKELCALRRFIQWCQTHGIELPAVPGLPKGGHPGTRAKNARKRRATIISPADGKRILMAMPERSPRTKEFVRPLFVVLWETGLRGTTVLKLETPLHYKPGAGRLFISREIDKEGFERWVPLSPAARKALDRACPSAPGRLFGAKHSSLRKSLDAALVKAGLSDRRISVYDFKHTRISIGANSGAPLAGIAHLVGHKHISTTALYVQTGEGAAAEALTAMARSPHRHAFGGHSGGQLSDRPLQSPRPSRRKRTQVLGIKGSAKEGT